ncbi:sensor histidine kinase [Rummeliibacillus stabekisii]|uniref:sensor histidine kinase n=1 Tax=Rummeliibacillus stabekisii TaxID=241244 RepID=UPI0020418143|nr:sensor histidine kinase [Rummeliibacillus stabekisii]MCM3317238.1 sensor histidine kinase [Rummeliibacillus stabekisii]
MDSIKLFIKDHIGFLIFNLLLVLFILLLYWLDGFRNTDTAIYTVIISIILTITFLFTRYVMRQSFYGKILQKPLKMEEALQKNAKMPENIATEKYIHELYRLYELEAQALYAHQKRQMQFMNQWVHQMKTPISVLELLLQDETELDRESVREEVERLRRGLETVLMNARLDTFEEDMKIEQVALLPLVSSVINENKRLFIKNQVYPQIKVDEDCIVATDAKWFKFIVGQFITNAVKYTFEKGKKVYISSSHDHGHVILTIKDEGIGIPPSDLKRVTKAFFTGENGRKTAESTGMGLYLAKEVCEKLGHHMEIDSAIGEGTTVRISFKCHFHE